MSSTDGVAANKGRRDTDGFFAKYLTNQNLLQLQLSDSNFRRYILVQFLILFQYLKSTVKFKTDSQVLTDDQSRWVEKSTKLVYSLIEETPPNGKEFGKSVRHILQREEQWNNWKNEGCKSLKQMEKQAAAAAQENDQSNANERVQKGATVGKGSIRKRKRKLGDQIQEANANKKFLMGNANLTKLWNLCPDNFEAASSPERDFLPSMDEYLSEAVEQLDPAQQVEETYRKVHDGQWGWRALRLLAKKSPFFFTFGNNPIGTLPKYLTNMLKKHYPDWDAKSKEAEAAAASSADAAAPAAGGVTVCTEDHLTKLADKLGSLEGSGSGGHKWTKLIPKLGQTPSDLAIYQKEESEESKRALLMLRKWAKEEGEGATKEEIKYILEGLKMDSVLEGVF